MAGVTAPMWVSRERFEFNEQDNPFGLLKREYVFVRTVYNHYFCFCRKTYSNGQVIVYVNDMTQDQRIIHEFRNTV